MPSKKAAIIQSNYIPWKGYFDLIDSADLFIIYDDVQYTKNDWRNRNLIKTPQGLKWLTVPAQQANRLQTKILEIKVCGQKWRKKHWKSIEQNYAKAPYFKEYKDIFAELYLNSQENYLSLINYSFILAVNQILGIDTEIAFSHDFDLPEGKTERLVELCKITGATDYISGPAAKSYLDQSLFEEEGIGIHWFDYQGYPEYRQLFPPFVHGVSVLDLIFNTGPEAKEYISRRNPKLETN